MTERVPTWYEYHWRTQPVAASDKKVATQKLIAQLLLQINILLHTGQWKKVSKRIDWGLKQSDEFKIMDFMIETRQFAAALHRHMGKYDAAISHLQQALSLVQQSENRDLEANVYNDLGIIRLYMGDYTNARHDYEEFIRIMNDLNDRTQMAKGYLNMGIIFAETGAHDKAQAFYEQSLRLCEARGDRNGLALTLNNMGNLHVEIGKYDQAENDFKRMLEIVKEIGFRNGEAVALGNLGNLQAVRGAHRAAISYMQERLTLGLELGDPRGIGFAMGGLGVVYTELENTETALHYLEQAIVNHRKIGYKFGLITWLAQKAECLLKLHQYEAAMTCAAESIELSQQLSKADTLFNGKILLARIHFRLSPAEREQIIASLEQMLGETDPSTFQEQEQQAALNYELRMLNDELERIDKAEEHRQAALELYQKLYEKTPRFEYKNRIAELSQ